MDVKQAVQTAKSYLIELYEDTDEKIKHVGLEEVVFDDDASSWRITIGFSRTWEYRNALSAVLDDGRPARDYKVVEVNDSNGHVISLRDRLLADDRLQSLTN